MIWPVILSKGPKRFARDVPSEYFLSFSSFEEKLLMWSLGAKLEAPGLNFFPLEKLLP